MMYQPIQVNKTDLIIPVWNLRTRGLVRVAYSLHSLSKQTYPINKVWVMDGSSQGQYEELKSITDKFPFCTHVHIEQEIFNKPQLLNKAISYSDADYIIASDADYIFRSDFVSAYNKHCAVDKMLLKQVQMLPNMNLSFARIDSWKFGKYPFNMFGKLANGAAQCATREYFLQNPYNEEMTKLGGMDNLAVYTAELKGLKIEWIDESVILHQFHPISKLKNDPQFEKNQKIIGESLSKLKNG